MFKKWKVTYVGYDSKLHEMTFEGTFVSLQYVYVPNGSQDKIIKVEEVATQD